MNIISNAKWNSLTQFFKIGIQAVNLIYLAKIIPPSEYGVMAMAVVVINLGILLRDLGTSAAIIQRKELSETLKNTIFWLNSLLGLFLAFIIVAISPLFSSLFNAPELTNVLILLSITFPFSSIAATHLALLERESLFKKISTIEISSSLISVVFAIIMANLGFGVYSLVVQAIVLSFMSMVQFWFASNWRPSFKILINKNDLMNIFGFSANLSLFNLINYFSRNADSFFIGRFMSAGILGNYNLAYRIMLFPLQSLTFVTNRSLYPVLSRVQDDNKKIFSTYSNCVFIIVFITAPLMSGLAYFSDPFIRLIFGSQWDLTASILKWLAPTAILQAVLSTSGSVFMAKGRTDVLMRLGIIGAILQVGSFFIGVNYTITTFSMCYFIANLINFFPVMYCLMKVIEGSLMSLLIRLLPIFLSTILMLSCLFFLNQVYPISKFLDVYILVIFSLLGSSVYILFMVLFSFDFRRFLISMLRARH
ncbi:lipopolysaccharide biosynthesis protein [Klebsiella variicola]|uniref:lipopolysaccharide biosynthesis protein n=1 Tax=Klebsiella variicola TaxID=244366 RepID=UPI000E2D6150|nr:lipopolysaccharide biosynthesis protein [Klebsiella variicola]SXF82438.1 polysaccharide biosynthesis protein [Klebsiella variicola]